MGLTRDDIRELLRIFADSELQELRIEIGETRLYVSRSLGAAESAMSSGGSEARTARPPVTAPPVAATSPPMPIDAGSIAGEEGAPSGSREGLLEVRSPLLGVFYRRPSPDQAAFVEVGDIVGPDDAVCIVDVMKMFTRVSAGVAGRIVEILAADGQLVQRGEVIMLAEPS